MEALQLEQTEGEAFCGRRCVAHVVVAGSAPAQEKEALVTEKQPRAQKTPKAAFSGLSVETDSDSDSDENDEPEDVKRSTKAVSLKDDGGHGSSNEDGHFF